MRYSFHPEARTEFKEATIYYFEKSPSLGAAFYSEVESAIEKIIENPDLYRVIDEDI
jgi:plasmid stabilization system protein ParE